MSAIRSRYSPTLWGQFPVLEPLPLLDAERDRREPKRPTTIDLPTRPTDVGLIRRMVDHNPAIAAVILGASQLASLGAPLTASADPLSTSSQPVGDPSLDELLVGIPTEVRERPWEASFDDYFRARAALEEVPTALAGLVLKPVADKAYEIVDRIPAPIRRPFDHAIGVLLDNLMALPAQALTSHVLMDTGALPESSNVHMNAYPQIKNSCGETMLATWLKGRGVPIATGEVDTQIPFYTGSSGLVDAELRNRGFSMISGPGSFGDLKTYLAHGYPVMVSVGWANGGGHYALVTGYDDATKTLTINGYGADGKIAKVSYDKFQSDWKRHSNMMTVAHPLTDARLSKLRQAGRLSRKAEVQEGLSISEIWLTERLRLFVEAAYRYRNTKHDLTIRVNVNTAQKYLGPAGMLGGSLDYRYQIRPQTSFHLHMERLTIKGSAPKAIKDIIKESAFYAGLDHRSMSVRVGYEREAFQAAFQARLDRKLAHIGAEARVDVTLEGDVRVFVGISGTF